MSFYWHHSSMCLSPRSRGPHRYCNQHLFYSSLSSLLRHHLSYRHLDRCEHNRCSSHRPYPAQPLSLDSMIPLDTQYLFGSDQPDTVPSPLPTPRTMLPFPRVLMLYRPSTILYPNIQLYHLALLTIPGMYNQATRIDFHSMDHQIQIGIPD